MIYVERPLKKKSGGLIAALVVILIAIVGTLGATYLAVRGDLRGPWAAPAPVPTDILLIGAGDFGPAPALTDSAALVTFDTLSLPADAATDPLLIKTAIDVVAEASEPLDVTNVVAFKKRVAMRLSDEGNDGEGETAATG